MNKELVKLIFVLFVAIANLGAVYILLGEDGMLKQKRTLDSVISDSGDALINVGNSAKKIAVRGTDKLKEIVVSKPEAKSKDGLLNAEKKKAFVERTQIIEKVK